MEHDVKDLMEEVAKNRLTYALEHGFGDEKGAVAFKQGIEAFEAYTELTKVDDSHYEQADKLEFEREKLEVESNRVKSESDRIKAEAERVEIEKAKVENDKEKIALEREKLQAEKAAMESNAKLTVKKNRSDVVVKIIEIAAVAVVTPILKNVLDKGLAKFIGEVEQFETYTSTPGRSLGKMFKF